MHKIQMLLPFTLVEFAIKKFMTTIKPFYVKVGAISGFTGKVYINSFYSSLAYSDLVTEIALNFILK